MANFNLGETVICSVEVKNDAGTLVDPATSMMIKVTQINPQYAVKVTATAMTKDSAGKYHYDLQTSAYSAGNYEVEYTATDGTRIIVQKDSFRLEG